MKQIIEPSRAIDILTETDVLVVGSGPAGLSAAIASAREGVETTLLERYGCFGGNITQAMVESIGWYRHQGTIESEICIGREFEKLALEIGGERPEPQSLSQAIDADIFKTVADQMIEKEGVNPLLHCYGVQALVENGVVKGVITESKSGRQAILAKKVIDASGDADIAYFSGAPYTVAAVNKLEGVSVSFGCSGVNRERFMDYVAKNPSTLKDWATETTGKEDELFSPYLSEPFKIARQKGEIPDDVLMGGYWSTFTEAGEATYLNLVYMLGLDPLNVKDLTKAEIEGRKQALLAIAALKKYTPGFENAKLRTFGASLGVRESRKITGEYNLTGEDVKNEARFEDSIGIFPEFLDAYGIVYIPTTGRYFQIPYRALLPQKVENLLVAGRCVSGDRISHSAIRQMMCCSITGQGAGVAAAIAVKKDCSCRDLNIELVQKALIKQGVRVK